MNKDLWYYWGRVLCFFGQHHYHDIDSESEKIVMRLPPGIKIKARYCCRCHDLDIKDIDFGNKT